MADEQELKEQEQAPNTSAPSKTNLSGIITSLGGGVGIAAILGVIIQVIQPSFNQPAVVESSPTPTDVAANNTLDISGVWQGSSSWGDITFEQNGSKVNGTYKYERDGKTVHGQIEAELVDTTYNFTWWEADTENSTYEDAEMKGTGYLTLTDNKLIGRWKTSNSKDQQDLVLTRQ